MFSDRRSVRGPCGNKSCWLKYLINRLDIHCGGTGYWRINVSKHVSSLVQHSDQSHHGSRKDLKGSKKFQIPNLVAEGTVTPPLLQSFSE